MENKGNSLAKIAIGLNVALILAVIILFVKMPSSNEETADVDTTDNDSTETVQLVDDGKLTIGFFYADSLNSKLLLMKDIEKEMSDAQASMQSRMQGKQRELDNWQKKWQDRGPLLSTEQEQYAMEAQQKQQDAMMFEQNLQMELAQKQEQLMMSYITRVSATSKRLAEDKGYDFILSYQIGQNVFYASPLMDVTNDIVELMNADYRESTGVSDSADGGPITNIENATENE